MTRPSLLAVFLTCAVAGCSTLPVEGPSARDVEAQAGDQTYAVVDLDPTVSQILRALPAEAGDSLAGAESVVPLDRIGVGDTLSVSIYEPSGALFGSRGGGGTVQGASQTLPPAVVDGGGAIQIPFAGAVRVEGLTVAEAGAAIRRALVGRVGNPQVTVTLAEAPSTGVTVLGEVRTPGRVPLATGRDRLLDVVAASGGTARAPEEVEVVVSRGEATWRAPYTTVTRRFDQNVRLAPGDRVTLEYQPRRYSVMGALGAVSQAEIGPGPLTLAAALARAGGPNPDTADARSVLIFRFEDPAAARALGLTQRPSPRGVPVVYRLDLSGPNGLFVASDFEIRPDDLIFVPRSGSTELRQFFELVQSVTRVVYDVSVTSALNLD
ncbi:polysaccharide biosynthesis/export family protein [Brevundimonas poindexterae]|uniref:polysaccharide biosynthesis/export family protein n=1 Tax=Brevundimonas poindexterae TaxID=74325 RepID=UPI001CFF5426|nr:polysaccharide biosynthesis/export family protein [Brevundimonas poindexterae]